MLGLKAQPGGTIEFVTTKDVLAVLPMAAAAERHAASVAIRTEPAGHSLLPESPDTYAPAHDGTARAALGRAAAAAHASTRAAPQQYSGVPVQQSGAPSTGRSTHQLAAVPRSPHREPQSSVGTHADPVAIR